MTPAAPESSYKALSLKHTGLYSASKNCFDLWHKQITYFLHLNKILAAFALDHLTKTCKPTLCLNKQLGPQPYSLPQIPFYHCTSHCSVGDRSSVPRVQPSPPHQLCPLTQAMGGKKAY